MPFVERIKSGCDLLSEKVDALTRGVCILLVLLMTLEVIVAVFFRYALDSPIRWGEELARLLMVWAGLLGVGIALKDGDHIGLEMVVSLFRGRTRAWCNLISHLCVGTFLVILMIWGVRISISAWDTFLPAMQIKWTWSHLAVPVTAGIQLVHLASKMLGEIAVLAAIEQDGGVP